MMRGPCAWLVLMLCACSPGETADAGPPDAGKTWAIDCGNPLSVGNNQGVGHYCERDAECFDVESGLAELHCSTVLADNAIPTLCSSVCIIGATDCGDDAICASLDPIGFDLVACVPNACRGEFPAVFELAERDAGAAPEDAGAEDGGMNDAGDLDAGPQGDAG